jgi:hypothetical protein
MAETSSEAAGTTSVVEAAAAELSVENELPMPSSCAAAAASASGSVFTYDIYFSWWKKTDPEGVGRRWSEGQCASGIHGDTLAQFRLDGIAG